MVICERERVSGREGERERKNEWGEGMEGGRERERDRERVSEGVRD